MSLSQCLAIDIGDTIIGVLDKALEHWSEWGLVEKPRLVKVFENGLNHQTGLISSGDTLLVLKMFSHSFSRTVRAEFWASEHSVSPKLHMAANNIALYEFIDNQGYSDNALSDIAKTLTLAHENLPLTDDDFGLLDACDKYLTTADTDAILWHKNLMPALLAFCEDPTPRVFCHNDLVTQNCLFNNHSVKFIDWEFAQVNNPWFDLAAVIQYFELDTAQAARFLSAYKNGWAANIDKPIFHTAQIAVLWCDLLWSMHKFGNGYRLDNINRFSQLAKLAANIDIALPTQS